jgi:type I restriction enzyme R subunit
MPDPLEKTTRKERITPQLVEAGWKEPPHSFEEEHYFTDGRIQVVGGRARRGDQKFTDYLLRYRRDFALAVVEAKRERKIAGTGLQQAKEYAEILDLPFAYSTSGGRIIEFDYLIGEERVLDHFPSPDELFARYQAGHDLSDDTSERLLTPHEIFDGLTPRYYQRIAINRTVEAVLDEKQRLLLTMATGTGKTLVAFQICWKLWKSKWNRAGDPVKRPKILYLADRNVLVDDPKDKQFAPFGDARHKIQRGNVVKSREMYFAIYQAIAEDERRDGLYKEYDPDFFDLVVVDECHRGSARDESRWREILEYFAPAYQLGMTATPRREDNRDTYRYFGNPIYEYSLKEGIADGFLAPYRVHRVLTEWDASGWSPEPEQRDRYDRKIPEGEYHTKDFHRTVALKAHTEAVARHLTDYLKKTDRFAKTIVFCVDQPHADQMRRALNNLNSDLVQRHPNYACRVTSDEGDVGKTHLSHFKDVESTEPVIVTTSKMLTTGVDVPTCENVVIARMVGSMPEFKQIIGRGTRVRDDYDKLFFTILDYTGSATRHFADPDFDGYPAAIVEEEMDDEGGVVSTDTTESAEGDDEPIDRATSEDSDAPAERERTPSDETADDTESTRERQKYYVDDGHVSIVADMAYEYDHDGNRLRVVKLTDYAGEEVRTLFPNADALRSEWRKPDERSEVVEALEARGVLLEKLVEKTGRSDADPFDLLCHLAYDAQLRTREERARRVERGHQDFFEQYEPEARAVLDELLDKYTAHGPQQLHLPDVLKVPPLSGRGNVSEIAAHFGGVDELRNAVNELQTFLYEA